MAEHEHIPQTVIGSLELTILCRDCDEPIEMTGVEWAAHVRKTLLAAGIGT